MKAPYVHPGCCPVTLKKTEITASSTAFPRRKKIGCKPQGFIGVHPRLVLCLHGGGVDLVFKYVALACVRELRTLHDLPGENRHSSSGVSEQVELAITMLGEGPLAQLVRAEDS